MAPFCGDPLWDADLTWNTDSPDLTECFQETVLVYAPAAVLLLFLPLQALYIKRSRDRGVPWTLLNVARTLLTFGLVIVAVWAVEQQFGQEPRCSKALFVVFAQHALQ